MVIDMEIMSGDQRGHHTVPAGMASGASLMGLQAAFMLFAFACACSSGPASPGVSGSGGQGSGGTVGSSDGGGGNGSGGVVGTGGGGASGNDGGSGGAGGTGDGGPADRAAGDGMAPACPGTAIICDDFEGFADGATALGPTWAPYTNRGSVRVDATKPRGGNRALHVTTMANRASADILKVTADGSQVAPPVIWGRIMVWVAAVPAQAHWSFSHASGPTAANRIAQVKYSHGGQNGKLFAGYSVRDRPLNADGSFALRGGAPDPTDPQGTIDCFREAPTATMPLREWVCWEWKYDATKNQTQLFINGAEQTEVSVMDRGMGCVGGINPAWAGPIYFNKVIIGWEQYQNAPAQEAWIDDVALGPERIGCNVN